VSGPDRALPVALAALLLLACSRDTEKQAEPAEASPPVGQRVTACALVTEAEVAQATGHPVLRAIPQDTLYEPGYWESTCAFQLAGVSGPAAIVTVGASGDYPSVVDGAELADAVSAEAMGISARPLAGFALPAATYPDTGVIVQKGAVRLVVTGRAPEAIRALAATVASRLP
jgi:hypothetical protein